MVIYTGKTKTTSIAATAVRFKLVVDDEIVAEIMGSATYGNYSELWFV